ncbi:MAG: hypothetical protein D6754_10035 [Alphaproteobacteria bacterium]|nr:MAG: hypothetical protein D6754_10035 [Alphaproteobacteria bacterium]
MTDHNFWGLLDITYIYLGGLGVGAFFVSAMLLLLGRNDRTHFTVARYGAFLAFVAIVAGGILLPFELEHPFRAWRVYLNFAHGLRSPMFYGAWFLVIFGAISFFYALTFMRRGASAEDDLARGRKVLAWLGLAFGLCLGLYYGVLHASLAARPLWHSPVLPLMFLVSAYMSGAAGVLFLFAIFHRKNSDAEVEKRFVRRGHQLLAWILILAGIQAVLVFLYVLFANAFGSGDQSAAIQILLPGGAFATQFWLWAVVLGILVPIVLAASFGVSRAERAPVPWWVAVVVPLCVLIGGYVMRYDIIIAGQITHPMGL